MTSTVDTSRAAARERRAAASWPVAADKELTQQNHPDPEPGQGNKQEGRPHSTPLGLRVVLRDGKDRQPNGPRAPPPTLCVPRPPDVPIRRVVDRLNGGAERDGEEDGTVDHVGGGGDGPARQVLWQPNGPGVRLSRSSLPAPRRIDLEGNIPPHRRRRTG